ncbi:MAG: hypothetical protein Q9208_001976 [Pyrenodesmia sp. 3 TL-2023]
MTTLLTGGTGKTSLRIARLLSSGNHPYIVASRSGTSPIRDGLPCKFDWNDSSTWRNPWDLSPDIKAVWLVVPGILEPIKMLKPFVEMARSRGCERFVLLSASVIEEGGPMTGEVHRYLRELEGNMSEAHHRPTIRDEGKIYSATGDGKLAWVSCGDIAAVTYRALVDDESHDCEHIVYGRELLGYGDLASILTDVLGKPVTHVHLTESELAERYTKFGVPEEYAKILAEKDTNIKNGGEEHLNDTVEKVTGKPPKTFREFAEENKAVWE